MDFFNKKYNSFKRLPSNGDDESESFLEEPSEQKRYSLYKQQARCWKNCLTWPIVVHATILLIWISIAAFVLRKRTFSTQASPLLPLTYSPAQTVLHSEARIFAVDKMPGASYHGSPYAGVPRPELETAWHELLQYSNIRLTTEEMDKIDPERKAQSVHLPDGGYFGTIEVLHELHCIKHLHRYLWAEHYFPALTSAEIADRRYHLEHCLDVLRQGIMCRADLTPITMRWGTKQAMPVGNFSSPHTCAEWSAIEDWTKDRSLDRIFDKGYLEHPVLGEVYSDANIEHGNLIGTVHDD